MAGVFGDFPQPIFTLKATCQNLGVVLNFFFDFVLSEKIQRIGPFVIVLQAAEVSSCCSRLICFLCQIQGSNHRNLCTIFFLPQLELNDKLNMSDFENKHHHDLHQSSHDPIQCIQWLWWPWQCDSQTDLRVRVAWMRATLDKKVLDCKN